MLNVGAAAASIAAVVFSAAVTEPNLIEAPSTVHIGQAAVGISVVGRRLNPVASQSISEAHPCT
jgi:hypothetical protein